MSLSRREDDGLARWVLILALAISIFILVFNREATRQRQASPTTMDEQTAPALALMSKPVRSLEGFFFNAKDRARAHEENKLLRAELRELREAQDNIAALKLKIQKYEAIIGADTETDIPLEKIAARAVSETNGPFVQSLLLNIGQDAGVKIGHPVMTHEGLVGHVIKVGERSSRVLKLTDLNSRIAVMSVKSHDRAILAGKNSGRPELIYLGDETAWEVGDHVMTSGDDGLLPQGLRIGQVSSKTDETIIVTLGVERAIIDWVWVLPYNAFPEPEIMVTSDEIEGDLAESDAVMPDTDGVQ